MLRRDRPIAAALAATLCCASAPQATAQTGAAETFETSGGPVVMEEIPSLPNHTIYHPRNLGAAKRGTMPVFVFGNGACGNAGNAFGRYLAEIASHGFVVIANGPIRNDPFGRPPRPGQPMGPFPAPGTIEPSSPRQMTDAIDWATSPARKAEPLGSRIAATKIAVGGQSCGGLQAIITAGDPRVKTAVIMNSGILREMPVMPGLPAGAKPPGFAAIPGKVEDLKRLHTPMFYMIGGPTDIAYKNANGDFEDLQGLPVFRADIDVGHGGTYWDAKGGRFAQAASQWLLWQLKGDATAAQWFTGKACGYCTAPGWTVRRKNLD